MLYTGGFQGGVLGCQRFLLLRNAARRLIVHQNEEAAGGWLKDF